MGFFGRLDQAANWFANWQSERWTAFGETFSKSWTETLPNAAKQFWSGATGLASAAFNDEGEWGSALRNFADGLVGMGSGILGGTLGTLGEVPIVHEPLWLLDKAYRYGIARPASTIILAGHNADAAAWANDSEEYRIGDGLMAFFDPDLWRRSWNESERATPGQAMVWTLGGAVEWANGGDDVAWLEEHDPRTYEGQLKYNSAEAEGLLKYGSGTIDLLGALYADPSHGLSKISAAARLRYVDQVATPARIESGKVHAELGTNKHDQLREAALRSATPEEFRDLTMPDARYGGPVAAVLHSAARMPGSVFDDAYLAARAGDRAALGRLVDNAPAIASDLVRTGADKLLSDASMRQTLLAGGRPGDAALLKTDADALVEQLFTGQGTWGSLTTGPLIGEARPRVTRPRTLRAGYHNTVLHSTGVVVGRPLLQRLMPSQGWTPMLDAVDGTGLGLRQFKANIERLPGVSAQMVNQLTSEYGAASTDAARKTVAKNAVDNAISALAARNGVPVDRMREAMEWADKWIHGAQQSVRGEPLYITQKAAGLAEKYIAAGRTADAAQILRKIDGYKAQMPNGEPGYLVMADADGRPNLVPVPGTNRKGDVETPGDMPVLSSQLTDMIFMPDFRALDAGLKWWKRWNPDTQVPVWRAKGGQAATAARVTLAKTISALDFANMLWKSSALIRPAQMPRNLGDETLRRMAVFGKTHLLMSAFDGTVRTVANLGTRSRVGFARLARRQRFVDVAAAGAAMAPVNPRSIHNPASLHDYDSINEAFVDGALGLDDLKNLVDSHARGNGKLPAEEATLWNGHRKGLLDKDEYNRLLARTVLGRAGRVRYLDRTFRVGLLTQLRQRHDTARKSGGVGQMAFDPFTGIEHPALAADLTKNFERVNYERIPTVAGSPEAGALALAQFVERHVDELLMPNHTLGMWIRPDGDVGVGVLRARKDVAAVEPVKMSANERWQNLPYGGLRAAGHKGFNITTPNNPAGYKLRAVFDGHVGEKFQRRASSAGGNGAWRFIVGDVLDERLEYSNKPVLPDDKLYDQSWERAVNAELASDPVARLFLQGKTDAEVIAQLETKAWGSQYLDRMHFRATAYVDQVQQIKAMVDDLLPDTGTPESAALRLAALQKAARRSDLDRVVPDRALQPEVHGASVAHTLGPLSKATQGVAKVIDKAQKVLSDLPVDKASRFPFMTEAYRRHLTDVVQVFDREYGKSGEIVPADMIGKLEHAARERALHDTRYWLYDTAQRNDVANLLRLVVPFSSAIMDANIKYGRMAMENPARILQAAYYWQTFERNEMVQDENGHVLRLERGEERWYAVDPETGEQTRVPEDQVGKQRYVQFRLPSDLASWAGQKLFGVDAMPVLAVNKKSFNMFLDPIAGAGPLVGIPANEFSLKHPEFAESKIVSDIILPFGPSVDRKKVWMPSHLRVAWDAYLDEEGPTAEGYARAIFQAEMNAKALDLREDLPTLAEAREKAGWMFGLRFLATFVSPVSFQARSPYQPYVDAYRQLQQKNPGTAEEDFYRTYGEEFFAVTMAVTRNNLGMGATAPGLKNFKKHQELLAKYPEFGGLITGSEGGAYLKSVYEAQKEMPVPGGVARAAALGSNQVSMVRETMSPQEAAEDLERRRGWQGYSQLMDLITAVMVERGITSLRDPRARDLRNYKQDYIAANFEWFNPQTERYEESPWYEQFATSGSPEEMQARIDGLWELVQEPGLQNRDDIQGLIEYLDLREEIQELMARRGVKTLESARAADLANRWEADVFELIERNLPFAAVWNRYLSNDDKLTRLSDHLGPRGWVLPDTPEDKRRPVQDATDYQLRERGYEVMD